MTATERSQTAQSTSGPAPIAVFLDLDTVLLATHPGKYGPELGVQADVGDQIERLAQIADRVVVTVNPPAPDAGHVMDTDHRLEVLRAGLGDQLDSAVIVQCPHSGNDVCDCAKPGSGLINLALDEHGLRRRGGWYVGGDQEGVVAGRQAGLHTIRIGPLDGDPLSAIHRPDYEARDLMDATHRIMLEVLAAD